MTQSTATCDVLVVGASPPILKSALSRGRRDPRIADLRRGARIVVTGWVLCVIPLLTLTLGYLLLHLPGINRALWHSASLQAHLVGASVARHDYAVAALGAMGVITATLAVAGSLYVVTGLARRGAAISLRWSAGRPARRLLAAVAGLACITMLAAFWTIQGQFRDW
jgi:putative peptide zinc metalloprotease protein